MTLKIAGSEVLLMNQCFSASSASVYFMQQRFFMNILFVPMIYS